MDAEAAVGEQACVVDFLMEAGTTMIAGVTCGKRTALQSQTQRAAMDDAVRCDGRCNALRHFTRAIPMRQEGPNNRTLQPPIGLQRPRLSYPSIPSEPCLLSPKNTCCAGSSGPPDRLSNGIQGTQKQDGASQEAERRKMCNRTERTKRPSEKLRMRSENTNGRLCCACHWNIILCKSALESGTRKLLHQRRPMS